MIKRLLPLLLLAPAFSANLVNRSWAADSDVENPAKIMFATASASLSQIRKVMERCQIDGSYRMDQGRDVAEYNKRRAEICSALGQDFKNQTPPETFFDLGFKLCTFDQHYELTLADNLRKSTSGASSKSLTGFDGFLFYTVNLDKKRGYFSPNLIIAPFQHPACAIDGQSDEKMPYHYRERVSRPSELIDGYLHCTDAQAKAAHWGSGVLEGGMQYCELLVDMPGSPPDYAISVLRLTLDSDMWPANITTGYKSTVDSPALAFLMRSLTMERSPGKGQILPEKLTILDYGNLTSDTALDSLKSEYPAPKTRPAKAYEISRQSYLLTRLTPIEKEIPVSIPEGTRINDTITKQHVVIGTPDNLQSKLLEEK